MAFVQSKAAAVGSGTIVAATFDANVTVGNLIMVDVHLGTTDTFVSVTDTQGNTYIQAGTEISNGALGKSRQYYTIATATGALTVTLTGTASGVFRYIAIHEYSITTTFDTSTANAGTGTTLTSGSFTVAQAGSLLHVFGFCSGTGSASGGYNSRETVNGDITSDKTASTGSQTATAEQTGTSDYNIHAAVFNTGAVLQQIRPDADNAAGSWTTTPLWSKIDEAVTDDADFITNTAA